MTAILLDIIPEEKHDVELIAFDRFSSFAV